MAVCKGCSKVEIPFDQYVGICIYLSVLLLSHPGISGFM